MKDMVKLFWDNKVKPLLKLIRPIDVGCVLFMSFFLWYMYSEFHDTTMMMETTMNILAVDPENNEISIIVNKPNGQKLLADLALSRAQIVYYGALEKQSLPVVMKIVQNKSHGRIKIIYNGDILLDQRYNRDTVNEYRRIFKYLERE